MKGRKAEREREGKERARGDKKGQLSLASLRGRLIEYQLRLG